MTKYKISNKGLLSNTGNNIQYLIIYMENNQYVYMCVYIYIKLKQFVDLKHKSNIHNESLKNIDIF